jgi:hypothetical protein
LNRLTSATVSANIAPQKLFSYDPVGNLLSKTDVGAYTYPLAGSALPHAVSAVNGTINSTFSYDPNGNQTAGLGRSISYTSYNQPASITQGASTENFAYDMNHQRMWRGTSGGGWLYFDVFGGRGGSAGRMPERNARFVATDHLLIDARVAARSRSGSRSPSDANSMIRRATRRVILSSLSVRPSSVRTAW